MATKRLSQAKADEVRPALLDTLDMAHDLVVKERKQRGKDGPTPETMTDVLLGRLTPRIRTQLVNHLIAIAMDGLGRTSLDAIREIFDRAEGKVRQQIVTGRDKDDPLLTLLRDIYQDDPKLAPNQPIDALFELMVDDDEELDQAREADL